MKPSTLSTTVKQTKFFFQGPAQFHGKNLSGDLNCLPRILQKSVKLTYSLYPEFTRIKQRAYHFSYLFQRNKLLSIGQNLMSKEEGRAFMFGQRFKTGQSYLHAEI